MLQHAGRLLLGIAQSVDGLVLDLAKLIGDALARLRASGWCQEQCSTRAGESTRTKQGDIFEQGAAATRQPHDTQDIVGFETRERLRQLGVE